MIEFDRKICGDLEQSLRREWLETNGIGGFACGTVSGANTRRYDSILTAAAAPPLGRVTTISRVEETVWLGGRAFHLSTNLFPDNVVAPEGYKLIESFRLDPFPVWTFDLDGTRVEKRLFMVHGTNTTVVRWRLLDASENVRLTVRPLLAFVDYHALQHRSDDLDFRLSIDAGRVTVNPPDQRLHLHVLHDGVDVRRTGYWYNDLVYAIETERGFDDREDLYQPFEIEFDLASGPAVMIATTDDGIDLDYEILESGEMRRRARLVAASGSRSEIDQALVLASDQFIVARGEGETVIAGYPWFSDWGRDTMIALPGLTLSTRRFDTARGIITEYAQHFSEGMLPNRFPDHGDTADYNTVDATLWYFEAVRAYVEASGDIALVRDVLYEKLKESISYHVRGTRFGIKVDADGLLAAGTPGVQLTWMDAKIGDVVITPRNGKAVEIQALWYNALMTMAEFASRFGHKEDRKDFQDLAFRCRSSFEAAFWNERERCLFDVADPENPDASIRPNQLLALSLYHQLLAGERAAAVVDRVERDLLTPFGLRTLSPRDPRYCPTYIGSPFDRDSCYHQGTVWAWLMGPFVDAYRRTHEPGEETERRVGEFLSGLYGHLLSAGVGQISEIFDGDPPHHPRGCFAQAWSVGEILRIERSRREA